MRRALYTLLGGTSFNLTGHSCLTYCAPAMVIIWLALNYYFCFHWWLGAVKFFITICRFVNYFRACVWRLHGFLHKNERINMQVAFSSFCSSGEHVFRQLLDMRVIHLLVAFFVLVSRFELICLIFCLFVNSSLRCLAGHFNQILCAINCTTILEHLQLAAWLMHFVANHTSICEKTCRLCWEDIKLIKA